MANSIDSRDFCQKIELDRNSTQERYLQSYHRLTLPYHPDHHTADRLVELILKEISKAV